MRRPPRSPLFPYTTLFRSDLGEARERLDGERAIAARGRDDLRSEEHTSELQSRRDLVCRLLLEKKRLALSSDALACTLRNWAPTRCRVFTKSSLATCQAIFFNDTATTEIYTLSLHDALPI